MRSRDRTSFIPYSATKWTDHKHAQGTRGSVKGLVVFVLAFSLLFLFAIDSPSYADLPCVMHSPQGALDVAAALPGWYGLLKKKHSINPTETTVSSEKTVAGLMKQAIDVTAMLPKDGVQKPEAPKPEARVVLPTQLSPADVALRVAARVPQFPATMDTLKSGGKLLWPTDGLIYSAFGATRGKRGHGAIDIVTKKGTPIAAAESGTVIIASNGGKLFRGYGKVVIIDHDKGLHTLYSHCDKLLVKMGQKVRRGEFVGTVGRTGRATTDHCHFEVRMAGKKVDPLLYLPSRPEMVKALNWHSKPSPKKN